MTAKKPRATANRPTGEAGKEYHIGATHGSIAARCLLVGDPERAEMVAKTMFKDAKCVGNKRGLKSYTGRFNDIDMSVVTTGMGGASTGIVLQEAVHCGARTFMHVGTCGGLARDMEVGSLVIATGAVRFDGASDNWAPIEYPAVADWRMVTQLESVVRGLRLPHRIGLGVTTSCFNEGQARPDDSGYIPERLRRRHLEVMKRGVLFYAMEDASIFVWCSTHGGIPVGSINAVLANRVTGEFKVKGIENAVYIASHALHQVRL